MLQTTHQPEPSLRHTLASRLESSLQHMHTPRPAPEPDPMLLSSSAQNPNSSYDDGWAIFDSNSIALAASQFNMGSVSGNGGGMSVNEGGVGDYGGNGVGTGGGGGGMQTGQQQQFGDIDGLWLSNEQYADAWQSTMFRIFGNGNQDMAMSMGGNGMI